MMRNTVRAASSEIHMQQARSIITTAVLPAAALQTLPGMCKMQALVDDTRVGQISSRSATRDTIFACGGQGGRTICSAATPH